MRMKNKILKPRRILRKAPKAAAAAVKKKTTKPQARVAKEKKEIFISLLSSLQPPRGSHKRRKLLGRGPGSGHGKTSTRGSKGQTSRTGRDFYTGFEGGQTPLIRRIPKRGFTSRFKKEFQIVNLDDLDRMKEASITPELMETKGLIKDKEKPVKVLGDGKIKSAVTVQAHAFSKKAAQEIKNAGGQTQVIHA